MNKRQAHHAAVVVLWFVLALVLLIPLAALADCQISTSNEGSLRFYLEIEGEAIPNESGNPLYFVNPINAATWATQIAIDTGQTVEVVRRAQSTRITAVCDIQPPVAVEPPWAIYATEIDATGNLVNAQPLDGATLARVPTWFGIDGDYAGAMLYCCKSDIEAHRPVIAIDARPLVAPIDIAGVAETPGQRELYADFITATGQVLQNHTVSFTVEPPAPVEPPVEPPIATEPKTVVLTWTIPNQRENGDDLPVSELCCYLVEYGTSQAGPLSQLTINPGSATTATITDLTPEVWHFRVYAEDTDGLRSQPSGWVSADLTANEVSQ